MTSWSRRSRLRVCSGRGGAAFSAGLKWSFLAPARPSYLVINGDESEPGTFKDRQLLERDPHQMVEGVIITAIANEVHHAFVYIRGEYPKPARRVQQAVDAAYDKGYLGAGDLRLATTTSRSPSISAVGPTSVARRPP